MVENKKTMKKKGSCGNNKKAQNGGKKTMKKGSCGTKKGGMGCASKNTNKKDHPKKGGMGCGRKNTNKKGHCGRKANKKQRGGMGCGSKTTPSPQSGGKKKLNNYFTEMLKARKADKKQFEYNGVLYKQVESKTGMKLYKKA